MEATPREKYELKKAEREKGRTKQRMDESGAKMRKGFLRLIILLVVLAVVAYGVYLLVRASEPDGPDFSISHESQGAEHIADGAEHPPYNSNPPSSGWHFATPASGGFYDEPLPDERVVHNLEHGDIWIAYRPDIGEGAKDTLRSFAGRFTVVSPREANEGDISLVAWGRVDTFDITGGLVDEERIRDFIKRYDNRGPERLR